MQRGHWHKRENVLGYLAAGPKPAIKRKLSATYERPHVRGGEGGLAANPGRAGGGERLGGNEPV
jgi:hypothetical protein